MECESAREKDRAKNSRSVYKRWCTNGIERNCYYNQSPFYSETRQEDEWRVIGIYWGPEVFELLLLCRTSCNKNSEMHKLLSSTRKTSCLLRVNITPAVSIYLSIKNSDFWL